MIGRSRASRLLFFPLTAVRFTLISEASYVVSRTFKFYPKRLIKRDVWSDGQGFARASSRLTLYLRAARPLKPPHGLCDHPVDDRGKRLGTRSTLGERAVEDRELAMGAGPAGEDLAGM